MRADSFKEEDTGNTVDDYIGLLSWPINNKLT